MQGQSAYIVHLHVGFLSMSFYFWCSASQNTPVPFALISLSSQGEGRGKATLNASEGKKKVNVNRWAEENGKVSECSRDQGTAQAVTWLLINKERPGPGAARAPRYTACQPRQDYSHRLPPRAAAGSPRWRRPPLPAAAGT